MKNNNLSAFERRFFASNLTIETREEGDEYKPSVIEGYAAMFNKRTVIGDWFEEEIMPGAFDDVLADDVRCLKNHDPNFVLGRTKSGTLEIWVDDIGLKYRYTTPNRSFAKDLEDEILSGDVSQSSFAFRTKEVVWHENTDGLDLRQIKKFSNLFDVSPVTYPAYQDTDVSARADDFYVNEKRTALSINVDVASEEVKTQPKRSVREAQLLIED